MEEGVGRECMCVSEWKMGGGRKRERKWNTEGRHFVLLAYVQLYMCVYYSILPKDYRGIYRLLSYMNKDKGSEVNHCCQAFANFSAGVKNFIRHIFCINFVIINLLLYKLINFVMVTYI